MTLSAGSVVASYRVEELLGRGGMGVVYLAEHLHLRRRVALKVLSSELAGDFVFRERFVRESQLAASLEHPNVVPIYDAGEADGVLYIAMRYVEGSDLKSVLAREGSLSPARALAVVEQVAGALDAAHAAGLVHRDVKPANILIGFGDRAYLTDFGIARRTSSHGLTKTGSFLGSVDYCPPEQIEGKTLDGRADVYSLGCVLYHCLAGQPPFVKESEVAVIHAHLLEPVPALSTVRPDLPRELDGVIVTALAKHAPVRYSTCGELARAVREALPGAVSATPAGAPPTRASPDARFDNATPTTASVSPRAPRSGPPREGYERRGSRRRRGLVLLIALCAVGVAGGLAFLTLDHETGAGTVVAGSTSTTTTNGGTSTSQPVARSYAQLLGRPLDSLEKSSAALGDVLRTVVSRDDFPRISRVVAAEQSRLRRVRKELGNVRPPRSDRPAHVHLTLAAKSHSNYLGRLEQALVLPQSQAVDAIHAARGTVKNAIFHYEQFFAREPAIVDLITESGVDQLNLLEEAIKRPVSPPPPTTTQAVPVTKLFSYSDGGVRCEMTENAIRCWSAGSGAVATLSVGGPAVRVAGGEAPALGGVAVGDGEVIENVSRTIRCDTSPGFASRGFVTCIDASGRSSSGFAMRHHGTVAHVWNPPNYGYGIPPGNAGRFTSVDRAERCEISDGRVACSAGPSGAAVELVVGATPRVLGAIGSSDSGGSALPHGVAFANPSGTIRCGSSGRGITCTDVSSGDTFSIGDSYIDVNGQHFSY